jgi:FKBP-type peptidyl-prolyl cis-trans isomerase (trigger factor)
MKHNSSSSELNSSSRIKQGLSALSQPSEITCAFVYLSPTLCTASIIIPAAVIDVLYHEAALSQQQHAHTRGFSRGQVPIDYIKQHYQSHLVLHLQELLFKYCVINALYQEIRTNKIVVAGDPRLIDITLQPGQDAKFKFELTLFPEVPIYEWKHFPFKAPKRKRYKDLDKQVELFLKEEKEFADQQKDDSIIPGDWVDFDITLLDHEGKPIASFLTQNFWMRIGREEAEGPLRELFLGKKAGDFFHTKTKDLQDYFSAQLDSDYIFGIEIKDVTHNAYFCFEQFKKHFRLKTNKAMHQKLIEVFSYRNDMSQRRSTAEEILKLMLAKHPFSVPQELLLREQNNVLEVIQNNPDYNVYRTQKDFKFRVRQLAERQAKESIFIDQFAYHENIPVSHADLKAYFNFLNRHRSKEFIYFRLPSFKLQGQHLPMPAEEIKRVCLREKALNHMIFHLTRR